MKQSPLAAGLRAAAGRAPEPRIAPEAPKLITTNPQPSLASSQAKRKRRRPSSGATVLIGGHFTPEVRRTLLLVQAESINAGKSLKVLLGEAINDICAKYGKPQPYSGEDE